MGKTGLHLFYYAIAPLHQQEYARERGLFSKGIPRDVRVCAAYLLA